MRVLITGGAGLIGSYVVDRFVRAGHHVTSVVRSRASRPANLLEAQRTVHADVGDYATLRPLMDEVDFVLHLAAVPSPVGRTFSELFEANSARTLSLLEAAAVAGVRGVVIASSISILGMAWAQELFPPLYLPVDEDHVLRPQDGYSLSKEIDEATARAISGRYDMPVISLRLPFTHDEEHLRLRRAAETEDAEVARQCAKELWAYLDVRDAAAAFESAVNAIQDGLVKGFTALNIVAEDRIALAPLVELISTWMPNPALEAEAVQLVSAYDSRRARAAIGFRAKEIL